MKIQSQENIKFSRPLNKVNFFPITSKLFSREEISIKVRWVVAILIISGLLSFVGLYLLDNEFEHMAKANVLTLKIPAELKQRIALVAEEHGVTINQLAMYIFAKEIGNLEIGHQIAKYWQGFTKDEIMRGFDEVMAKVKSRNVPVWDKIE